MTRRPKQDELIFDWNTVDTEPAANLTIELDDETLRDGLQSPSVTNPTIAEKIQLLHLMVDLGIQAADIGLPGAGPRALADVTALAKEIADHKLPIAPNCAARTVVKDIEPVVEASHRSGTPIEVSVFIGSSPIREYVENWTLDHMLRHTETAVTFATKNNLSVMFVTEDTTRAHPPVLEKLYTTAIECGARRICLADTVGYATPHGTRTLVRFIKDVVRKTGEDVKIDWHAHSDRGLSVINSLVAAEAGVDRVHGTGLGVGERCGNAPMEQLLINFRLLGYLQNDLAKLDEYCELVSRACGIRIPCNQPIVGEDAFRTATGVHAAAVIKAMKKGDQWLADRIYSSVPADWVGRQQTIEVGPMSGASNVIYWLKSRGVEPEDKVVEAVLKTAKQQNHRLGSKEILSIVRRVKDGRGTIATETLKVPKVPPPEKRPIRMTVNGSERTLLIGQNQVLLEVLREDLGLTGTKFGCELGECGVCTVMIAGEPKLSCLTLASLCDGKDIATVEGLAGREAYIVEKAFAEEGASQCGYCTPSMALMLNYLLAKKGDIDIREELSGNICRCTGFVKILRAYERSVELAKQ